MHSPTVIRSYDDLHATLRARADALEISRQAIDELAGLPAGYAGKLLGGGQVKKFGGLSLELMLQTLGLRLVVVEDPEALGRLQGRYEKRDARYVRERA